MHKLTIPVSASEAHSLANVRKTREQMVDEVRAIVALRDQGFDKYSIPVNNIVLIMLLAFVKTSEACPFSEAIENT